MNIQPKPLITGAIRLLTPVLFITMLSGSTSWFNLSRSESASASIQPSVFGMMHLADDTKATDTPSTSTQEQGVESDPRHASSVGHVKKMGPLIQPDDLPPFNPGKPAPLIDDLPDSAVDSDADIVTFFQLPNKSAHDLLLRITHIADHQNHFMFGSDFVGFDVNHIEEDNPSDQMFWSIQTSNDHIQRIEDLPISSQEPDTKALYTRVYKVNPDTFLERMEALLVYPKPTDATAVQPWTNVQDLVHDFLSKIGIEMPHKDQHTMMNQDLKASFFNDRNGSLFVRLTLQDLEILEAALAVLQEPGARNTKVALNMHIIQLDESGIEALDEFGFDKPDGGNDGQFERIIDTPSLQHFLLRMKLAPGVELLQSPHITALNGRRSELKAQELRRIVTHNESGNIQTEEVATGPSLSVIPRIQANGQLEMTTHFELLEFLGYDDPGPFQIVSKNDNQKTTSTPTNLGNPTTEGYQQLLKEMDLAPTKKVPQIILKYMPNQLRLKQLSDELETAHQSRERLLSRLPKNTKDTINIRGHLASLGELIKALQKQMDNEVAGIRRHTRNLVESHAFDRIQSDSSNTPLTSEAIIPTATRGESEEKATVPLPRFKRLELNTKITLQSGQTLVMGGLKSMETIRWKNSVPIMSKIPPLRGPFRGEGTSTSGQYIYVLITPRILE